MALVTRTEKWWELATCGIGLSQVPIIQWRKDTHAGTVRIVRLPDGVHLQVPCDRAVREDIVAAGRRFQQVGHRQRHRVR